MISANCSVLFFGFMKYRVFGTPAVRNHINHDFRVQLPPSNGCFRLLLSAFTLSKMTSTQVVSSLDVVRQLWRQACLPPQVLENTIKHGNLILGHDPAKFGQSIRSSFQLTAVAQGCTAAIALASHFHGALLDLESRLDWAEKKLEEEVELLVLPKLSVDARQAIAEYKAWTRIYQAPKSRSTKNVPLEHMLKESMATNSDEAKKLLSIPEDAVADWDPLAGLYRTKPSPGRAVPGVVRLHTNFPHHKLGALQLLGLAPEGLRWQDEGIAEVFSQISRSDVQKELAKWEAFEFEKRAQERGLCVTAYRSSDEWKESEMGKAVQGWMKENGGSAFRITRIPVSTTKDVGPAHRSGKGNKRLRVIDMSRVIAGPHSTRSLAAHGADVLLLSKSDLPRLPLLELDMIRGKRTAFIPHLEKGQELQSAAVQALIRGADVFSQAYRPGGLAERGMSAENLQALRPGIVFAELCAFGFTGPWAGTRGYDSLTQTACGMNYLESLSYGRSDKPNMEEGKAEEVEPRAMPVQALDYVAGSLMCFATLASKCRGTLERIAKSASEEGVVEEGWKVQVSLASAAEWIQSLGQIHGAEAWAKSPQDVIPSERKELEEMASSYKVRGLREQGEGDEQDKDVWVLAIRHASVQRPEEGHNRQQDDSVRWTVCNHLNVDGLEWQSEKS